MNSECAVKNGNIFRKIASLFNLMLGNDLALFRERFQRVAFSTDQREITKRSE
ncbi:hypothetical protein [Labilibaculum antarcticum]|uniref:hypothetical protein n=1 Tax=Labilibaculum antarcticum TaxID=1717717 RepID=UPI001292D2DD|nr:hypothetical protein [Labilibaculum antarcticum]